MKSLALLSLFLLPFARSAAVPSESPGSPDAWRARVETQVEAFLDAYLTAVESREADAIRAVFVEDERFAWYTDGEKAYASADEVIAKLESMPGLAFSTETTSKQVVPLTGELAHARTTFQTRILQGGEVVHQFGGVVTWLLERGVDGEWRVLTGHTSTPKQR